MVITTKSTDTEETQNSTNTYQLIWVLDARDNDLGSGDNEWHLI